MILPCLACLALLTASALPVVSNDVDAYSCEEVSNVKAKVETINDDTLYAFYVPFGETYVDHAGNELVFNSPANNGSYSVTDVRTGSIAACVADEADNVNIDDAYSEDGYFVVTANVADVTGDYFKVNVDVSESTHLCFLWPVVLTASDVFISDVVYDVHYNLNQASVSPDGVSIVRDIVDILVSGITQLGAGIGGGVNAFAQALAFDASGEALGVFMVFVAVFAGLALCIGLTRLIFGWLQNLGGK